MQKEIRTVCYDDDLHLEAYHFEGIVQPFPNHFHDYYVIGFIEAGTRCLSCKNKEYMVGPGNILLFNPNDNHSCVQCDGKNLDYRGLNYLRSLHQMIMEGGEAFEKEEMLLLLLSFLIEQYGQPFENCIPECSGLSKSTLLRSFTISKGVTPYRYLQTIRICKAKELLAKGVSPIDAAMQTGFSDQSHFSNFFHMFIGLSPGAYRRIFKEGDKDHG